MKNPLDKDVFVANAVAAGTGAMAYRNGKSGLDAINIGLWWRWWYKNMTLSFVLFVALFIYCYSRQGDWPWLVAQGVINTLVAMITYGRLIAISSFKQRLVFRPCWALARHFPYTARAWLYLLIFLPAWGLMFLETHHGTGAERWSWF